MQEFLSSTRRLRVAGCPHPVSGAWAALCLGAALAVLAPAWIDGPQVYSSPSLALASIAPWAVVWIVLSGATARPALGGTIVLLLLALLADINRLKLRELGLPLIPGDSHAISQMLSSPELYLRYARLRPELLLYLALALLFAWRERANRLLGLRARSALVLAGAAGLASLQARAAPWPQIYDQSALNIPFWHPAQAVSEVGLTAYFMLVHQNTRSEIPVPDPELLQSIFQQLGPAAAPATPAELPDIIVVQSESFFDPGDLAEFDGEQWLPNLYRLQALHSHGRLRVPTFGGLTTRTEFEFLTGFPLSATPALQYPYQGLVHGPLPSLPWLLRSWGYATHAVHPYHRRFYARDQVYPRLGFENFHSISDFEAEDYHGYYVSDEAMLRHVLAIADSGPPRFVFAVSMENHGPWDAQRGLDEDELPDLPARIRIAGEAARSLRQFLHHAQRADATLGRLAEWVNSRDRPTVALFYGDHLPNLVDAFAALPFRNGEPPGRQTVPWIVLDNRRASSQRIDVDSAQLAALMLGLADLRGDRWFDAIERLRTSHAPTDEQQRAAWHTQIAADRLGQVVDVEFSSQREGHITTLRQFGPKSIEQGAAADGQLGFWFEFESPPPRHAFLMLGERRLQIRERNDRVLTATLPAPASGVVTEKVQTLQLTLTDPLQGRRQRLGELAVRPRAERLPTWLGLGEGRFCAVETWGPEDISLAEPINLQADGRSGLWLRAGCVPSDATLMVGGRPLQTTVNDNLVTAALSLRGLAAGDELAVELRSGEELLAVGTLRIH